MITHCDRIFNEINVKQDNYVYFLESFLTRTLYIIHSNCLGNEVI